MLDPALADGGISKRSDSGSSSLGRLGLVIASRGAASSSSSSSSFSSSSFSYFPTPSVPPKGDFQDKDIEDQFTELLLSFNDEEHAAYSAILSEVFTLTLLPAVPLLSFGFMHRCQQPEPKPITLKCSQLCLQSNFMCGILPTRSVSDGRSHLLRSSSAYLACFSP